MSRHLFITITAAVFILALWGGKASWAGNNDYNDHWIAAGCTQVPHNGRLIGKVKETDYGPAVGHAGRETGSLVLYCNVKADDFHNWIQVMAQDNSPSAFVTATLYQQGNFSPSVPTEIVSVTTTDKPGVQIASLFFDPPFEPDEFYYKYFIKIELYRGNPRDQVRVFNVSLMDVL